MSAQKKHLVFMQLILDIFKEPQQAFQFTYDFYMFDYGTRRREIASSYSCESFAWNFLSLPFQFH